MDRIRVSEALDTGSIPVGRAKVVRFDFPFFSSRLFQGLVKALHILLKTFLITRFDGLLLQQ